jgi:secondary thiamine-phosphate synthase enzyme
LKQAAHTLKIGTQGRELIDITRQIELWLAGQLIGTGLLTVFCAHTSASLLIQENAAPEVRSDLLAFFARVAPEDPHAYRHDDEGPDDMPAHIRSALTSVSLSIPLIEGRLALGMWQAIYLFEHRRQPQQRTIVLHLIGE